MKQRGSRARFGSPQHVDECPGTPLTGVDRALEAAIQALLAQRGAGKSICPSEAARAVDPAAWNKLMPQARAAARRLVADGVIVITQQGSVVDPSRARGAIRLRRA
jgi:hypothetical protein